MRRRIIAVFTALVLVFSVTVVSAVTETIKLSDDYEYEEELYEDQGSSDEEYYEGEYPDEYDEEYYDDWDENSDGDDGAGGTILLVIMVIGWVFYSVSTRPKSGKNSKGRPGLSKSKWIHDFSVDLNSDNKKTAYVKPECVNENNEIEEQRNVPVFDDMAHYDIETETRKYDGEEKVSVHCSYEDSLRTLYKSGILTRKELKEMLDKHERRLLIERIRKEGADD